MQSGAVPFIHACIHSCSQSFDHSFVGSFIHPFTQLLIHLFTHSLHSHTHSSSRSFSRSLKTCLPQRSVHTAIMMQRKARAIVNEFESVCVCVCVCVYRMEPVSGDAVCCKGSGGTQSIRSSSGVGQLWWRGCAQPVLQR